MALTEEQRKKVAAKAVREAELNAARIEAVEILSLKEWPLLVQRIAELIVERDEWKRRAQQHGCDVERGDPDCG